jgi:hypothetical protein
MMRADYDSRGKTLQITLQEVDHADHGDRIGEPLSAIVAVANDTAVAVDLLGPDLGVEAPLTIVAERYDLDREALLAAAHAALAAPDRVVMLDVGIRAA